jgi:cation diffusion facilitator CzcD-associated flavoprotein CzcO
MFSHPRLAALIERRARRHIASQVPDPDLRARVTPGYRLGCKRILGSDDWYPAIGADNVEVVSAGLREVTPNGVVDHDGVEHRLDTIIFGTGCVSWYLDATGRNSTLWQGSVRAYQRRLARFEPSDYRVSLPAGEPVTVPERIAA